MKMVLRTILAVTVLVISSHADVIYNTFGPNYGVGNSTWLVGHSGPFVESVASPFRPAMDVDVTQLDLGFASYVPVSNIEIDLANDEGGLPGSVIQSWDVQFLDQNRHIITLMSNAFLPGQRQYWVTARWKDDQTDVGWYVNPLNLIGPVAFDVGSGWEKSSDALIPAFDVIGTPVPEPGTLCLLGTAGLGIAGFLRRKL